MHRALREIIARFNPDLLDQLDDALELEVTNFKRDLFPSLLKIDMQIPGAGFQYVIWIGHEPKFPFPGWGFDAIARPTRYIPTFLASGMKFINIARSVAVDSGGHVEECMKAFCATMRDPPYGYVRMPLGTLARNRLLVTALGQELTLAITAFAMALINPAKHEFHSGSPTPVVSFPDALAGYFASRILGFQILDRGSILDKYVAAVREAYRKRIAYTMPSGADPSDDPKAWPLLEPRLSDQEDEDPGSP